jgi:16S rRNA processing protein RimM
MWDDLVTVGRIVRPHGIRGAVVVQPESDFAAERFRPGAEMQWLENGAPARVQVAESREFRGRWIVRFDGVSSMTTAETLRDRELRVPPEAVQPLGAGHYYVHDLRGCRVETSSGDEIGRVSDVLFGGGPPVLIVTDAEGREVMVPLAEEICRTINPAEGRIVIDPPGGLIELNRAAE